MNAFDGSSGGGELNQAPAARSFEPLQGFNLLQEQIELTVALLDRLRSENEQLRKELLSSQEMVQLTQDELDRLTAERNEISDRIQSVMKSLNRAGG